MKRGTCQRCGSKRAQLIVYDSKRGKVRKMVCNKCHSVTLLGENKEE